MSYNDKKFLDINGLKHLISILDDYPTNEVLGTVINAIESEIPTNVSQLQNDAGYLTTHQDISGKANSADLAAVATSGDYDDLINKPTIPAVPVQDVQVNGTSVVTQGVANVPVAGEYTLGVVKVANGSYGVSLRNSGDIQVEPSSDGLVKTGTETRKPIVPYRQHMSTFYGLAKAAGADMASSSNPVGTYTDAAKQKIQNMLGITDLLSTEETTTATAAHALNSLFLMGGKLYKTTAAIAIGDAVVEGENCQVVKADEVFPHDVQVNGTSVMTNGVANVPIATNNDYGAVKVYPQYGIFQTQGILAINSASENEIKTGTDNLKPIVTNRQHIATFYGLSKLAGVDLANETVTLGTYPETSKTAIRSLIGAAAASDVTVSDVQVNGTSVLSNGVANIPIANGTLGAVQVGSTAYGLMINTTNGIIQTYVAEDNDIKSGTRAHRIIDPATQHKAVFYGLAKAAGADEKDSTLSVGTYTETAKTAIRNMLGAASTNIVAVQDEQPTDTDTKVWLPETQAAGVEVPTYAEFQQGLASKVSDVQVNGISVVTNGMANVPIASKNTFGVVKFHNDDFYVEPSTNTVHLNRPSNNYLQYGTDTARTPTISQQHISTFYGLAKAAGDTTQAVSDNAVGTYTADASAAIRSMLGAVGDVQVNGTSIVSNGVANLPFASSSTYGVVRTNSNAGTAMYQGVIQISRTNNADIKAGTNEYNPVVPFNVHTATFYGLAKAAGDTTMASSSNAVGTYTAEAKSAIQSMLGIDLQSIASEVEIPLVETVSGTTPTISGQPNTRYVCGEVSTLSITPPSVGSIDVIFDSGSTPAVITVPNTVRWPVWFDATALEADTTYEILITDGVYGSVMTWAN